MSLRIGVNDEEGGGGRWENLPPELLWYMIKRVEETETCWPARLILSCASVCKSWRAITKDIVKIPELSGQLTFPISLKQPGPRDSPIQCYIKRNRETFIWSLYLGPEPSYNRNDMFLLAAKREKGFTHISYFISLVADDFRPTSRTYAGELRSNLFEDKFTIYDVVNPQEQYEPVEVAKPTMNNQFIHRLFHSNKVSLPEYNVGTITYKVNFVHKCMITTIEGPRKMNCTIMMMMNSMVKPLKLKNRDPICEGEHFRSLHWHLNFRHRGTLPSANFQLVSADDEEREREQGREKERVILEFAKIGEDVFIMDYCYPLSAFQAFAICLSSFDADVPTCSCACGS